MLPQLFALGLVGFATCQVFHKADHEKTPYDYVRDKLDHEKTPYDYVRDKLDNMATDARSGMPLSNTYQVEESEDYPDKFEGAETAILHTGLGGVGGAGGVGIGALNQGIGYGGLGLGGVGLGQGIGIGLGGLGGAGQLGGVGQFGVGGVGAGGLGVANGVGYINPAIGGFGGVGGIGLGGVGLYHPYLGAQLGGGFVDKKAYDAAQKKGADENLEKFEKKAEEEVKHGQEGYQHGAAAAKAEKGESGYYKDEEAKKKAADDEKYYEGGQKVNKHGANEESLKKAKGHKKGHVTKGFKTSSSKNEEEKTESFYDEAHDEADHRINGQNAGSFGENSQQGFKGVHEEKILDANSIGKEGHHVSEQKIADDKGNKGEYLQKGYKGGAEQLEKFNNLGAHSIHGHQEASGGYQQNKGILPIHRRR